MSFYNACLREQYVCRKWESIRAQDTSIAPFEDWVRCPTAYSDLDPRNPEDIDKLMLSMKSSQRAIRYMKLKAFGNHFRIEDDASNRLQTYDSGVAFVFQVPMSDARDVGDCTLG
jgi:hypothetical protein